MLKYSFVSRKQAILPSRKCLRVKTLRVKHVSEMTHVNNGQGLYYTGKLSRLFDYREHSEN